MRIRTLSLWLGGALLGFFHVSAQAEAWTLTQALTAARRYSAELSASRNEASALDAMADSARQLPDPKLKFGIENVPVQGNNDRRFTREGMTMQRVGIMQRYVSGEKRDRKAQTLIAQSRSVEAQSQTLLANLQRDTAQAWLDLALSQQALASARALVAETERQQRAQRRRRELFAGQRTGPEDDPAGDARQRDACRARRAPGAGQAASAHR